MDDLISRRAAILAVGYYSLHYGEKMQFADKVLKELPSAQETGTWLVAKGACEPDYMECNRCGWITEYYGGLEEEWNYCPRCGAKMENGRILNYD